MIGYVNFHQAIASSKTILIETLYNIIDDLFFSIWYTLIEKLSLLYSKKMNYTPFMFSINDPYLFI